MKPIVQIVLPGVGTLYFALASIWGLPAAEQVVGSIAAVTTFLGLLLGLSSRVYNNSAAKFDGTIDVNMTPEGVKQFSLVLDSDPDTLTDKNQVVFKVNPLV